MAVMSTDERKELGRGKNVVLEFFERKLHVPKIYLDAAWDGDQIDVLAIDRSGVGDVHAVLLFPRPYTTDGRLDLESQESRIDHLITRLKSVTAHFKYIAAVETQRQADWRAIFRISNSQTERIFAPDFVGRIGLLHIDAPEDGEPRTEVVLRPERFRAKVSALADDFVMQHTPDWEIRDSPVA